MWTIGGDEVEIHLGHTSALAGPRLGAVRELLDLAFGERFSDDDWDHALGGMHAVAVLDGDVVGHAAVVARRLLHQGRALRAGYVEGVGVHPALQRQGLGRWLMESLDPVLDAYDLGALSASDAAIGLYTSLGWWCWRGPLLALTPHGVVATPDEAGGVLVRAGAVELDLDAPLTCDWRDGDLW
jgi:aminoglycoside 2'-N-acetyltransferase I